MRPVIDFTLLVLENCCWPRCIGGGLAGWDARRYTP